MSNKTRNKNIVLLDLGGVVFQINNTRSKKIDWKIINTLNDIYEKGQQPMTKNAFSALLSSYNQLTNQSLGEIEFLEAFYSTLSINWELIDIIKEKAEIIIVSDNYYESIDYCSKKYNFDKWSLHQVYSYEYKIVKSNPLFFKKFLKMNPLYDLGNMVLIDDSIAKIDSAAKCSIKGILYESNEKVKEKLNEYFS